MYEDEPVMMFNQPLSGLVGLLSVCILISQVFCMMLISYFWFYIFEITLCFTFTAFLSIGVRKRKPGHVTTYAVYLSMYICWVLFGMIFYIWAYSYLAHLKPCPDGERTDPDVDCYRKMNASDITALVLCIVSCCISILLSTYEIRLCFVLFRLMKSQNARTRYNVSYQTQFGPGRTPNSPPTYPGQFGATGSPSTPQGGGAADAGPLPEKPPGYFESVVSSTPASLQPETLSQQQTAPAPSNSTLQDTPIMHPGVSNIPNSVDSQTYSTPQPTPSQEPPLHLSATNPFTVDVIGHQEAETFQQTDVEMPGTFLMNAQIMVQNADNQHQGTIPTNTESTSTTLSNANLMD